MTLGDTIKGMVGLDPTGHADPDMKAVLDALKSLKPKPIEDCTVDEARRQPTPADAVKKADGRSRVQRAAVAGTGSGAHRRHRDSRRGRQ